MLEAERWSSSTGVPISSCGDSGNGGTVVGASPGTSVVFLLKGVTFRCLFRGVLVDIMGSEVGLRVIIVV